MNGKRARKTLGQAGNTYFLPSVFFFLTIPVNLEEALHWFYTTVERKVAQFSSLGQSPHEHIIFFCGKIILALFCKAATLEHLALKLHLDLYLGSSIFSIFSYSQCSGLSVCWKYEDTCFMARF